MYELYLKGKSAVSTSGYRNNLPAVPDPRKVKIGQGFALGQFYHFKIGTHLTLPHIMRNNLLFIVSLLTICPLFSQISTVSLPSTVGTWLTADDETGEAKSHIQIYEKNGKQYGKITKLLRESLNHPCDQCSGERKNKPMLDMVIIEDMELKNGYWQEGRILYPKQGKWYSLKYWLKEDNSNTLVVRGSFGPLYRTQYWQRVN